MPESKPRVPMGAPLPLSDEDLTTLTDGALLMAQAGEAQAAWRKDAPGEARELLDATEQGDGNG